MKRFPPACKRTRMWIRRYWGMNPKHRLKPRIYNEKINPHIERKIKLEKGGTAFADCLLCKRHWEHRQLMDRGAKV